MVQFWQAAELAEVRLHELHFRQCREGFAFPIPRHVPIKRQTSDGLFNYHFPEVVPAVQPRYFLKLVCPGPAGRLSTASPGARPIGARYDQIGTDIPIFWRP
jgi:hypothetical protein